MQLTCKSVEILFFLRIINHGDDLSWISHPHMMSSPLLYNFFLEILQNVDTLTHFSSVPAQTLMSSQKSIDNYANIIASGN